MSRVTAPVAKLSRSINSAAAAATRSASPLLDSTTHNAGAVLMPKYAELLRNRRTSEHTDSSRGMTTTHRPTPQPSLANRSKPLMQTFTSSAVLHTPSTNLDGSLLPTFDALYTAEPSSPSGPRVPILPDNYHIQTILEETEVLSSTPQVTIVASDPDNVISSNTLSEVEAVSLDGVDMKFVHEQTGAAPAKDEGEYGGGMLSDIWKGIVDDVLGPKKTAA